MTKKTEPIVDEPVDNLDYKELHEKSFTELAQPEKAEEKKASEDEEHVAEEGKKLEETPKKVVEEKKPVDPEELATKAAAKATEGLKKEIEEIKKSNLTKEEKKDAVKEVKSKWKEEDRNPKDYDEIYQEAVKTAEERAFERAKQWFEEREAKKADETAKETAAREKQEAELKEANLKAIKAIDDKIDSEYQELIDEGYVPKLVDDEGKLIEAGRKAKEDIFKAGMELNNERIKNGQPVIDSVAKIYFMHYKGKVAKQPAGADAPVSGATTTPKQETNEDYDYAKDHKKSFAQLARETLKRG